jgi:hypothetical protein
VDNAIVTTKPIRGLKLPVKTKQNVVWAPHEGAQRKGLTCPVWELLMHGNRGGGKTDWLLMDYASGVGRGYGSDYRGLLLREATTELGDVIAKSQKWFPRLFPGAKYNEQRKKWKFPDGETLWFNYARVLSDYDQYHGHEYPWIGWEELTNHAVDEVYLKLMSCNRCSNPNVPKKYRATCNPSGPGNQWVKLRFIDAISEGRVIREKIEVNIPDDNGNLIPTVLDVTRTHIFSDLEENLTLLRADPLYKAKILQMTQDNEMLRKAWIHGSWDLNIGGFFTDVWEHNTHVIKTYFDIPKSWKCVRSFDWGSSKPWCVTYFVEANGEQPNFSPCFIPKGSVIVINEIYGWTGKANEGDMATSQEMARRVLEMDKFIMVEYGLKVEIGPADTSIYDVKDGTSIGTNMGSFGCYWTRAYKGSGSRIAGWGLIRQMLGAARRHELEAPHLYFLPQAQHHIRVIPLAQRDPKKPEDIQCFVAGTMVDTEFGKTPIEEIRIGQLVHTPIGLRKVLNCGISGKLETFRILLSNGSFLQGTPDHKIYVDGIGLVPLQKIKKGYVLCQNSSASIKESNLQVEMEATLNAIQVTVNFLMEQPYCIGQSIKTDMEKFLKDLISTTKTTSKLIPALQTLSQFVREITQDTISKRDLKKVGICISQIKNGENLTVVKGACRLLCENAVKILPKENLRALVVVNLLLQNIPHNYSAARNVKRECPEKLKRNVKYVENYSLPNHIKQEKSELVVMRVDGILEERTVYNLNTEQAHLYYANDCLVSNTDGEDHPLDSMRYGLARKMMSLSLGKVNT